MLEFGLRRRGAAAGTGGDGAHRVGQGLQLFDGVNRGAGQTVDDITEQAFVRRGLHALDGQGAVLRPRGPRIRLGRQPTVGCGEHLAVGIDHGLDLADGVGVSGRDLREGAVDGTQVL